MRPPRPLYDPLTIREMAEFVLKIQDIDETGKDFEFPVTRSWLDRVLAGTEVHANEDAAEGSVKLRAHRQGSDVVVQGRVRADLVTECARCLEDAAVAVNVELVSLFVARGAELRAEPDELELTPEDLEREFYSGDEIVLDEVVRENLLLEVPIKPLCDEECAGIPVPAAVAGPEDLRASTTEGGVDPRLAPLLKLVGKLEPTEE